VYILRYSAAISSDDENIVFEALTSRLTVSAMRLQSTTIDLLFRCIQGRRNLPQFIGFDRQEATVPVAEMHWSIART